MRVLLLSWEYPPVIEGGLGRHVRKLAEQLAADGVEMHVLTRGGGRLPLEEVRRGVAVHRVREPEFPRDVEAFLRWVGDMNADMARLGLELCERHDFDLVHSHDWLVAEAAAGVSGAAGVPWLVTVHATEFGRHQGWVRQHPQSVIHGLERRMCRRADRLITCSEYMRGHVSRVFGVPAERITAIPNGIDPGDLEPAESVDPVALRRRFVVAGTGTAEAELKRQACELGLTRFGSFLGWVGDDMLHALYKVADLCIVPSIYEPFGLVALEAMASGCLCVVADTGGLREVVPGDGTAGLRFPVQDAAALRAILERVLTDDAVRAELVASGREHVLRFDWSEVARQTLGVYRGLVSRAGALR